MEAMKGTVETPKVKGKKDDEAVEAEVDESLFDDNLPDDFSIEEDLDDLTD